MALKNIKIYPNPANNEIIIENNGVAIQEITLYNSIGQAMAHLSNLGKQRNEINISELSPGIYFIGLKTDKGTGMAKIVIER
jgi:hypothetical protein